MQEFPKNFFHASDVLISLNGANVQIDYRPRRDIGESANARVEKYVTVSIFRDSAVCKIVRERYVFLSFFFARDLNFPFFVPPKSPFCVAAKRA